LRIYLQNLAVLQFPRYSKNNTTRALLAMPLSVVYNGATYYYILSLQGDVVAILDSTGAPYDAWGRLLTATGSMSGTLGLHNPLRYRGYIYDRETGLYYLQSRYYNPTICRFISADSIGFLGADGTPVSYNLFAYCSNNPVMGYDPSGEIAISTLITLIVGIIAVAATINDINQISGLKLERISSTDNGDTEDNVGIINSYKILTPWVQYGYGFYLNYINEQTRDIIDGTTVGVTYEWMLHNIAYAGASILGLDSFKASAESVDIGKTVFDDSHKGFIEHALKTPYIVLFPITAVIDLFINGGYR